MAEGLKRRPEWHDHLWNAVEDAVVFRDPPISQGEFQRALSSMWRQATRASEDVLRETDIPKGGDS